MAIIHMDNFSIYGTNTALLTNGVYGEAAGQISLENDPSGSAGIVLRFNCSNANTPRARFVLPVVRTKVGFCSRIWLDNLPRDNGIQPAFHSWLDVLSNQLAQVKVDTTGRLTFDDGTNSLTTVNPVVSANGWYHMESLYDTSGTGSIEVRVEGVTVLTQSGLGYSGKPAIAQVQTRYSGTNFDTPNLYIKDYVVYDTTGSINNNFLGGVIVYSLLPTSDVALNWTPTSGTNGYSILDNAPPIDTSYISAGTPPPAAYVGTLSDLPSDVSSVKALMTFVRASKFDGGDATLQASLISDPAGTPATTNGADRPITTTFTYWRDIFETDPKTSAAWLPAAVNAAQFKLNRTS